MNQYIVLPRLAVSNANAQPAWWIIGPPPITAYLGFARALARRLGKPEHDGVAIVHHDIQFLGENFPEGLSPHQYRAASFIDQDDYAGKSMSLSSQPTARCHLSVSIIIRISGSAGVSAVQKAVRGMRLAGGDLLPTAHSGDVWVVSEEDLEEAMHRSVRAGFSIVSRQDLMVLSPQDGDRDMLDVLLRVTRRSEVRETATGKNKSGTPEPATNPDEIPEESAAAENGSGTPDEVPEQSAPRGFLMPTTLGYAQITARANRLGVRDGLPHAYVEPLVGLVQYQSYRKAGLHFWKFQTPSPDTWIAEATRLHLDQ